MPGGITGACRPVRHRDHPHPHACIDHQVGVEADHAAAVPDRAAGRPPVGAPARSRTRRPRRPARASRSCAGTTTDRRCRRRWQSACGRSAACPRRPRRCFRLRTRSRSTGPARRDRRGAIVGRAAGVRARSACAGGRRNRSPPTARRIPSGSSTRRRTVSAAVVPVRDSSTSPIVAYPLFEYQWRSPGAHAGRSSASRAIWATEGGAGSLPQGRPAVCRRRCSRVIASASPNANQGRWRVTGSVGAARPASISCIRRNAANDLEMEPIWRMASAGIGRPDAESATPSATTASVRRRSVTPSTRPGLWPHSTTRLAQAAIESRDRSLTPRRPRAGSSDACR